MNAPKTKQHLIPPINSNTETTAQEPSEGIIRDILTDIVTDKCSHRAYTELKLVIDTPHKPFVKVMDVTTAKRLRRGFGEKLSEWFGQEVLICEREDPWGEKYTSINPTKN